MRSIIFKTKDMAQNSLEMSLQEGSQDYSQLNTCEDYINSARTQRNKYAPNSASTAIGSDELFHQSKMSAPLAPPLTARDNNREMAIASDGWKQRIKRSVDIAGYSIPSNSRNQNQTMTTAPLTQIARQAVRKGTPIETESNLSNTFGQTGYSNLKPNFFNIDLPSADMQPTVQKASIFHGKRNTTQPHSNQNHEASMHNRGVANTSDPLRMQPYTRQALKKTGCQKEQNKQYMSLVQDASKNNSALRHQLQQSNNPLSSRRQVGDANKALIAIMPVPEL